MASAVATNMPATGAMSFGWLGPRLSFGARDAAVAAEVDDEPAVTAPPSKAEPPISKDFIDFEFSFGGSATMLPADELFADGKLLPLRPPPAAKATEPERERRDTSLVEMPPTPERVKALHPAAAEVALDPYVFSPKAPTCSSRWRELLRLRKVQTPQKPSASPSASSSLSPAASAATPSRASNSSAARSLKLLLLQRNGGRASAAASSDLSAAPLLRDSSDSEASISLASSRFSLSSSSSSAHSLDSVDPTPRHSLDSVDPTPRARIRLVRSHPQAAPPQPQPPVTSSAPARAAYSPARARPGNSPARRRPSTPPPPPSVASVDSPRMNASGKIVFQGLERSSSSPAGSVHSMRTRSRVMDRSYSAGVRATPVVLNVPVCSRPVFGFFKDKKDAGAKDASSARPRSALGRRATPAPGGVSCRDLVNGSGN